MKKNLHISRTEDGNETITYRVAIPTGSTKEQEQILTLTAALEAAGWDGPFDGKGMDA